MTKVQMVQLLIEQGADVTMQDATYSTPLHLASYQGSAKTVQLLIEHGANVTVRDGSNGTPLHLASSWVSTTASLFSFIQQRVDRKCRMIASTSNPMKKSHM